MRHRRGGSKAGAESLAKITFIEFGGREHVVDVQPGYTVMEGAIWNDIPMIDALCGGSCACATCHIHVDPSWADRLRPPSEAELELLSGHPDAAADSRLSCQIKVTAALDGLVIRLPEVQRQ